jgi:hypothetical protein
MTEPNNKLRKLSDIIIENGGTSVPNLINWVVKDEFENQIGRVEDLLVDKNQDLVRYVHIVLDPDSNLSATYKNVLIPSGLVRADFSLKELYLYELNSEKLSALPVYDEMGFTNSYESAIIEILVPEAGKIARNPDDFYNYAYFETKFL